jgi:hypothetical protein
MPDAFTWVLAVARSSLTPELPTLPSANWQIDVRWLVATHWLNPPARFLACTMVVPRSLDLLPMMIATSAQGRMLAISFNCTDEYASEWLDVGREIIKSAIVTE